MPRAKQARSSGNGVAHVEGTPDDLREYFPEFGTGKIMVYIMGGVNSKSWHVKYLSRPPGEDGRPKQKTISKHWAATGDGTLGRRQREALVFVCQWAWDAWVEAGGQAPAFDIEETLMNL